MTFTVANIFLAVVANHFLDVKHVLLKRQRKVRRMAQASRRGRGWVGSIACAFPDYMVCSSCSLNSGSALTGSSRELCCTSR